MKRFFLIFALSLSLLLLFSCGEDDTPGITDSATQSSNDVSSNAPPIKEDPLPHEHTFSKEWLIEEEGHYRACICHPDFKDIAPHLDTVDKNGVCDVCQFEMVKATEFTFNLLDKDGQGVFGAEIKIYTMGTEFTVTTDEKGQAKASFIYTDGVKVRAMIVSLPDGYIKPEKDVYTFYEQALCVTVASVAVSE